MYAVPLGLGSEDLEYVSDTATFVKTMLEILSEFYPTPTVTAAKQHVELLDRVYAMRLGKL